MSNPLFKDGDDSVSGIIEADCVVADLGIVKQIPDASRIPSDDIFRRNVMSSFQNPMMYSLSGKLGIGDIKVKQGYNPA